MSLQERIDAIYAEVGPTHILPFVGRPFLEPRDSVLRTAVVGINSYLSPPDCGHLENRWFRDWWANAGQGKPRGETWPFYERALAESLKLASGLIVGSRLFSSFEPSSARVVDQPPVYGTNAIKVYLTEEFKEAAKVPASMIAEHARVWHAELDILAEYGTFPHLIVILGEQIWEPAWQALYPQTAPPYEHLSILEYTSAPQNSPCFHYVNRIRVRAGGREQICLLVRLQHPSAHSKVQRRAEWLLAQPAFRELVET